MRTVNAGGSTRNPLSGEGCTGYLNASAPDLDLNYSASTFALTISASAASDVSLVVHTPDGRWLCDDDGADAPLDAKLTIQNAPSGVYSIWVATYAQTDDRPGTTVGFSELGREAGATPSASSSSSSTSSSTSDGMPNWRADPTYGQITLRAGFRPDPHVRDITVGGSTRNPVSGSGCAGFINASAPDYELSYTSGFGNPPAQLLRQERRGRVAAHLHRRRPVGVRRRLRQWPQPVDQDQPPAPPAPTRSGWAPTRPPTTTAAPSSSSPNWTRSGEPGPRPGPAPVPQWRRGFFVPRARCNGARRTVAAMRVLLLLLLLGGAARPVRAQAVLDPAALPRSGTLRLRSGFAADPTVRAVLAGGLDTLRTGGCAGFVTGGAPTLGLRFRPGRFALTFTAAADDPEVDLVLLVRTPAGKWLCDDDAGGNLNPRLVLPRPRAGAYAIWVGAFDRGAPVRARVGVSELGRAVE